MVVEGTEATLVVCASWPEGLRHVREWLGDALGPNGRATLDIAAGAPFRGDVPWTRELTDQGASVTSHYRVPGDRVAVQFSHQLAHGTWKRPNARISVSGYRPDTADPRGWVPVERNFWIAACPDGVDLDVHETAQVLLWDADQAGLTVSSGAPTDEEAYRSAELLVRTRDGSSAGAPTGTTEKGRTARTGLPSAPARSR